MKILFATHRFYPPDQNGGAQISMHVLFERLIARGHTCEVVALSKDGWRHYASRALWALTGKNIPGWADRCNGYPTYRTTTWHLMPMIQQRIKGFHPDILLFDKLETLRDFQQTDSIKIPTVLSIVDVTFLQTAIKPRFDETLQAFSNSRFTQQRVKHTYGIETPVIYPAIDFSLYETDRSDAQYITMINPVPMKGVDVVLRAARLLPARKFLVVEGWRGEVVNKDSALEQLKVLPNVDFFPWTADMRAVFRQTRLLLAPSQCEEAFGRVALEAQMSGIPVVASDIGGLPEAVGEGGFLVDKNAPAEEWVSKIETILNDPGLYERFSRKAVENTRRPEFNIDELVSAFETLTSNHIQGLSSPHPVRV